MKYLAIVVLCGLAAVALAEFTPEQKEKFQQRIKECQAESGLAPDAVEKLKSGQATVEPTPEYKVISHKFVRLFKCFEINFWFLELR